MSSGALWLAVAALGLYHGLNPAMGWPLAVANGLADQFGSGTAVRPWDDGSNSLANAQTDIALAWGVALVIVVLSMAAYAVAARAERLVHRRFA